jgi:serine/threonine protein phosphatase PrpC
VEELDLVPGDILVLCSDGLMEGLTEQEMHGLAVRLGPHEAVVEMVRRCKQCLQIALSDTGDRVGIPCSDNMTAVVVRIPDDALARTASPTGTTDAGEVTSPAFLDPLTSESSEGEPHA